MLPSVYTRACTETQRSTAIATHTHAHAHTHTAAMQHKTAHLPPSSCHQCIPGLYGTPTQDRHTHTYSCNATSTAHLPPSSCHQCIPGLYEAPTQDRHTHAHAHKHIQLQCNTKQHTFPPAAAINGIPVPVQKANAAQPHTHTRIHTAAKNTRTCPPSSCHQWYTRACAEGQCSAASATT